MKKITTVMASAMLMGAAMTANAQAPDVPGIYAGGPLKAPTYTAPNLFVSEKTAFALLENAMQAAEGIIYASGCTAAVTSGSLDISVEAFDDGTGSLDISSNGVQQLGLQGRAFDIPQSPGGTRVVTGGTGPLKGKTVLTSATAYYNGRPFVGPFLGAMMVQSATLNVRSVNGNLDSLSGTVIKDFFKCGGRCDIPVIYDWGLQSVSKNRVPQDKWWQRSHANRSDGVFGRTHFRKDRLYSGKNGGACEIDIDMSGTNDADFFGQSGTMSIRKTAPRGF